MKTQTNKTDFFSLLTDEQKKTVALLQYQNEDFLIVENDGGAVVLAVSEEEAVEQFDAQKDEDGETDFFTFCLDNFIEADEYDEDNGKYLVLTDEEADEKAAEYIEYSLWAFTPRFLAEETGLPVEVFEAIQDNGKCESNNDAILSIIEKTCGLDEFIESAISADGRGHFIAHYDHEENEETVGLETFYIYRINF